MKCLTAAILLSLIHLNTYSQNKFNWKDDACFFNGVYSNKYSAVEIKNTYKLGLSDYFTLQNKALVFTPIDFKRLNQHAFINEYQIKIRQLKSLKIVNTPFWEKFKAEKIIELNQVYKTERAMFFGYLTPDSLAKIKYSYACIDPYVSALISGNSKLLILWKQVVEQQIKKKSLSPALIDKYKMEYNSKDKYLYAKIDIMKFWSNCMNSHISYVNTANASVNFRKLFLSVKTYDCDDAD